MRRTFLAVCLLLIATGPALAQRDFSDVEMKTQPVAGSVYMIVGAGGNIGVSAGDDGILIVDDQFKPLADKIRAALAGINKGDLKYVLNTHYHGDHTGSNEVWLWVFLRWPPSLLTWDILFLVPVPWIGPVLAPLIISVCLVGGSMVMMFCRARGHKLRFPLWHWGLAVVGGLVVLLSFTWDWRTVLEGRMPPPFRWWSFGTGVGMGLAAFALGLRSISSSLTKRSSTH